MTRDATQVTKDAPPGAPNGGAGSEPSLTECRAALDEMSAEAERRPTPCGPRDSSTHRTATRWRSMFTAGRSRLIVGDGHP